MRKAIFVSSFLAGGLLAAAAFAETPNRTTMGFPEFVEASGCVIVDMGGYQNLASKDGGNCPFAVTRAFIGGSHKLITTPGEDGVIGTSDDLSREVSDN